MPDPTDAPAPAPAPAAAPASAPAAAPAPAPAAAPPAAPAAPAPAPASSTPAAAPPAATAPAPAPGEQPPGDSQKTDEPKPAPKAPESYEFKTPEGANALDDQVLTELGAWAKDIDLTQEQAQSLIDRVVPKIQERTTAASMAALTAFYEDIGGLPNTWLGQLKADKVIGGDQLDANLAIAAKARDLGGPDFVKLLDKTGLGNHPAVIRTFLKIGRALSEEKFVTGGPAAGVQTNAADVLYGNSSKPKS